MAGWGCKAGILPSYLPAQFAHTTVSFTTEVIVKVGG